MLTEECFERICARHGLTRQDILVVTIFLHAHPETSVVRGIYEFLRGRGPAAVARGRAGQDTLRRPAWRPHVILLRPLRPLPERKPAARDGARDAARELLARPLMVALAGLVAQAVETAPSGSVVLRVANRQGRE